MKTVSAHPFAKDFLLADVRVVDCVNAKLGPSSPSASSDMSLSSSDDGSEFSSIASDESSSYWPYSRERALIAAKSNFNPWADEDEQDLVLEYPVDCETFVPHKEMWQPERVETPPLIQSAWWPPRDDVFAPIEYDRPTITCFRYSSVIAGLPPCPRPDPTPHPDSLLWRIRKACANARHAQANSPGVD